MRAFFLAVSLLVGLSPLSMAAQIYKWVDAQGVTHFDAQPPPGQHRVAGRDDEEQIAQEQE